MKGEIGKKYTFKKHTDKKMFVTTRNLSDIVPIYSYYTFTKVKDTLGDKIFKRSMYQMGDTDIILNLKKLESEDALKEI